MFLCVFFYLGSRDDFIGSVEIPIDNWDQEARVKWYTLKDKGKDRGQIQLQIK